MYLEACFPQRDTTFCISFCLNRHLGIVLSPYLDTGRQRRELISDGFKQMLERLTFTHFQISFGQLTFSNTKLFSLAELQCWAESNGCVK